jgi:hypothetical protein
MKKKKNVNGGDKKCQVAIEPDLQAMEQKLEEV